MVLRKALAQLSQAGYSYTIVNTFVSLIAFGRNLLFMKTLGLADVGQIAITQTIVMFVGFIQIGTINGAYILFSERKPNQTQKIVNLLCLGILALSILALIATMLDAGRLFGALISHDTLIIGVVAGIATLASTWMNNLLIAKGALASSNIINMLAVSISLVFAYFSSDYGLKAALLSILLQPLLAACGALVIDRDVRPLIDLPDPKIFRRLLTLGFMPYLASVLTLGSYQIERWAIASNLGEEGLGQFYLVMMYMTFFAIIPAALLNISFPKALRALQAGNDYEFNRIRKRHLSEVCIYAVLSGLITLSLLAILVEHYIPEYSSSVHLVFLVFPAVVILAIRDNAALVLYSKKKTRPIFFSSAIFVISYAACLCIIAELNFFSLSNVALMRGLAALPSAAYLFRASNIALSDPR